MKNTLTKILLNIFVVSMCLNTASAIRINEIMYNPAGTDTGREWIEVYNDGISPIDLVEYRLEENEVNHIISPYLGSVLAPGEYAILSSNPESFLLDYPDYASTLVQTAFSLSNAGELLVIKNASFDTIDDVFYDTTFANGDGFSLEFFQGIFVESLQINGTPGEQNQAHSEVPEFSGVTFFVGGVIALAGVMVYRRKLQS